MSAEDGYMTDRQWIRDALDRFEGPLLLYAGRLTGDAERARDVVQDTFLKLCRQRRADVAARLAEWLYTVCRNAAIDVRRPSRGVAHACSCETRVRTAQPPEVRRSVDNQPAIVRKRTDEAASWPAPTTSQSAGESKPQ